MEISGQHIRYFLFSQYLADGVRTTLEIVIPVMICALLGHIEMGYAIATGALCVSISDAPGPVEHKRNGMLYGIIFTTLMALLTGFANHNIILIGLLIAASSFFFSMFTVYGNRAAALGTGALLIMILRLTNVVPPVEVIKDSLLILTGGIWYMVVALLFYSITPYRPGQRALGDCIHEMSKFLRIKADFYQAKPSFEDEYHRMVAQQIIVSEKQDALRELLFKNRQLISESSLQGKLLILTFTDVMEMYEQMTATWYDYESLQEKFGQTGILEDMRKAILVIADELDEIGLGIQSNQSVKKKSFTLKNLTHIKASIDSLAEKDPGNLVLKKILVNLININKWVNNLYRYFEARNYDKIPLENQSYYAKFVSHQQIDFSLFVNNLHLESGVFRHSLRMLITCMTGFIVAKMIAYGHHSYWILLTVIIILKPGFGLTKERNIQRITGTIVGALIGLGLLAFIQDRNILYGLIVFFMIGTYTYQRINYIAMVIFLTPYILILFNLLGLPFWDVARERLLDTVIGSLLAFAGSYLLFPHWESAQLNTHMLSVLKANIDYLNKLKDKMCGKQVSILDYKLVRKELYLSIANLSAAFHRMLNDPKHKQQFRKQTDQFVVLNHILSSNVASLTSGIKEGETAVYPKEIIQKLKRAIRTMEDSLQLLDPAYSPDVITIDYPKLPTEPIDSSGQLNNQLDFINKIATDINKTAKVFAA
ncbi:FUSC family protein [soil metagenome]